MIQPDGIPTKVSDNLSSATPMCGGLRMRAGFHQEGSAETPLISVITVVRNGGNTLERTVQSVLNQEYANIEYLIIDGGSTDGTLDIIRKYDDRLAYWVSEPDRGIYDAMNKGIALASGDLIALLNSDDSYEPGAHAAVAEAYRTLTAHERCILYGDYYILDERLGVKTEFRSDLRFWRGMSICHQAMFVSRDIYQAPLLYDTSLRYAADYAFLVDAIRSGVRFVRTNAYLVTFGNAGASYTNVLASSREILQILRRRFGLFSRYLWLFMVIRLLRSMAATAAKWVLDRAVGVDGRVRLKLLYNRISNRVSHKV